ncbi:MAG: MarR family transcriptional regulator [Gammaproteobacteria bacterium]|nr:MarR family transcriptional regulator [Pseudomonadales bacterium]MCP5346459.1 MarR family transcriptional regulator [Pseudomonadales bacterium]
MHLSASQQNILGQLKQHGGQSVKVLARRLDMTTMGIRQHLADLLHIGLVTTSVETRQTRGRPLHLWELTELGHSQFPDSHREESCELIEVIREKLGGAVLDDLVDLRNEKLADQYRRFLADKSDLGERIRALASLRTRDGYMAEVRFLPDQNWLLIENHCPIVGLAQSCNHYCRAELELFQNLLGDLATVVRTEYLLEGNRRCAYKIVRLR